MSIACENDPVSILSLDDDSLVDILSRLELPTLRAARLSSRRIYFLTVTHDSCWATAWASSVPGKRLKPYCGSNQTLLFEGEARKHGRMDAIRQFLDRHHRMTSLSKIDDHSHMVSKYEAARKPLAHDVETFRVVEPEPGIEGLAAVGTGLMVTLSAPPLAVNYRWLCLGFTDGKIKVFDIISLELLYVLGPTASEESDQSVWMVLLPQGGKDAGLFSLHGATTLCHWSLKSIDNSVTEQSVINIVEPEWNLCDESLKTDDLLTRIYLQHFNWRPDCFYLAKMDDLLVSVHDIGVVLIFEVSNGKTCMICSFYQKAEDHLLNNIRYTVTRCSLMGDRHSQRLITASHDKTLTLYDLSDRSKFGPSQAPPVLARVQCDGVIVGLTRHLNFVVLQLQSSDHFDAGEDLRADSLAIFDADSREMIVRQIPIPRGQLAAKHGNGNCPLYFDGKKIYFTNDLTDEEHKEGAGRLDSLDISKVI
eukprot:UC4_evm3s197